MVLTSRLSRQVMVSCLDARVRGRAGRKGVSAGELNSEADAPVSSLSAHRERSHSREDDGNNKHEMVCMYIMEQLLLQ